MIFIISFSGEEFSQNSNANNNKVVTETTERYEESYSERREKTSKTTGRTSRDNSETNFFQDFTSTLSGFEILNDATLIKNQKPLNKTNFMPFSTNKYLKIIDDHFTMM